MKGCIKSFTKMVVGYDISAYTAMKCFSGAAVTRKTAEVVSNILGVFCTRCVPF